MTYILAIIFSVIVSGYAFASEITHGNIGHVQNGREPNAGAAPFPIVPTFQILAVGITWTLEKVTPELTVWFLLAGFVGLTAIWIVSFGKLRAEFAQAVRDAKRE